MRHARIGWLQYLLITAEGARCLAGLQLNDLPASAIGAIWWTTGSGRIAVHGDRALVSAVPAVAVSRHVVILSFRHDRDGDGGTGHGYLDRTLFVEAEDFSLFNSAVFRLWQNIFRKVRH
ncbi:hypothetical protein [Burkholderia lata]|uniref:hypothetical protein n=1 Tax=Burkholderia lata (strain ATCC 17760 / DSM 23089 / LMG 22485 / NCIMB 9086 / R18194 / 383) TaxID=482957 RepID=UPI0015838781|nr:hypothetical protein [Burkholderia lata]